MRARQQLGTLFPRSIVLAGGVLCCALLLPGCGSDAPPPADAAAEVAGSPVRWEEFEAYLERQLGDSGASLGSDVLSELFDQFLDERLLARLAAERGLVTGSGGPGAPQRAVERLLAEEAPEAPTAAEVAAFYEAHRQEFRRPERVRLRQILTEDRDAAERALSRVRSGAEFAAVAASSAGDPGLAAAGGLQGELARDELPPAFATTIFALAPGEVSDVIQADYGFLVFQVVERLPAEVVPLVEAHGEIEATLRRQAADRRLAELVDEARRRYDVVVYERNLPFNYRGSYLAP
ncbi:MAG TPA: peptidylprolyl isomerase [Thermoanaerobaculia bacterium]|nr:peptidylprolyl isomerase [Thermoanaerobaculia bacterium]